MTNIKASEMHEIAWNDHRIRFFTEHAKDKRVLDIGCVQHDPTNYLSKHWVHKAIAKASKSTLGIDLHRDGVNYLKKKGFNVIVQDACDFNLDMEFDVIVAGDVIEHLDNVGGFLKCCYKHLANGGLLLITTDNPWFWRHIIRAIIFGRVKNNSEHVSWIDPVLLRQLCERHDFTLNEREVIYSAREWWIKILPFPRLIKYPTYQAILRPKQEALKT